MFSKTLDSKNMFFHQRANVKRILNTKFAAVLVAITTTFLAIPYTLAETLDSYCIVKLPKQKEEYKPPQLNASVNGRSFHIVASSNKVYLNRYLGDPEPLSSASAPQYDFNIESLALGKSGWLWIDGRDIDYMVKLNLNTIPPTFGTPLALPDLKYEPCSYLSNFFGFCRRVSATYSTTLDRAFITGHRPTFLGLPDEVSFEMVAGEVKQLSQKLNGARFEADVPKLNGALFRGNSREAIFYDGVNVTTLLPPSSDWSIQSISTNERTFLGIGFPMRYLLELKAGPVLTPVSLPDGLLTKTNQVLHFFTMPNNPHLWVIKDRSIVTEAKGIWQTVVTVPDNYLIFPNTDSNQEQNGTMTFVVDHSTIGSSNYSLVPKLPAAKCIAALSGDKPIVLGVGNKWNK
jgi:hypothetical protein